MVLPNNQNGSPKSVLNNKALEDSSNDSNFNLDLYLNDEEKMVMLWSLLKILMKKKELGIKAMVILLNPSS
ncbi:hypothetical protein Tco_0326777 [Tanacetum coccineum]